MLATLADKPFDDAGWVYEIKWDGYRAIAEVRKELQFYSRNGISFLNKFNIVADALRSQPHEMILDGEIVAYDEAGNPSFQHLQNYGNDASALLIYHAFDLLYLNGHSTETLSLLQRKELLKEALQETPHIKYCDHVAGEGIAFFEAVKAKKLEGMIAKKADSLYYEGRRSNEWFKIKLHDTEEVVIAGFTQPRGSRDSFGALILGRYVNNKLTYAGHTGTGFDDKMLAVVYKELAARIVVKCPFAIVPRTNMPATWVRPELVCEIKYSERTKEGIFRHPVFIALRPDKNPADITDAPPINNIKKMPEKKPAAADAATIKAGSTTIKLTNQNKIYWPEEGYTKGDLVQYYDAVSAYILPYLKGRPESLNRFPNGITGESFYHKDAGADAPEWIETFPVFSESAQKEIDYLVCNNKATLLYLANLGCIEMNPWNSTVKKPDHPTYLIIDIDPSDNNTFDQVIKTAQVVKSILDKMGAVSYCKTSGASGLHVYVPMGNKYDYTQVKDFAHLIAMQVVTLLPDTTTLERSLQKRDKAKIYVDYLQNRKGQTIASAYSVRPKPGATVSTPLQWEEVKKGLHPSQFTIKNVLERLVKMGDIFAPVLAKGIDMAWCIKKMEG